MPAPGGGRAAGAGMWCPACAGACLGATAEHPELWGMGLGRGTAAPLMAAFRGEMRASSAAEGPNTFCLCAPFVKSRTYVVSVCKLTIESVLSSQTMLKGRLFVGY